MTTEHSELVAEHSDIVYDTALFFWRTVTNIFFREIRPRGAFNIPHNGPVIFVAAPHHNQVGIVCYREMSKPLSEQLVPGSIVVSPSGTQRDQAKSTIPHRGQEYEA